MGESDFERGDRLLLDLVKFMEIFMKVVIFVLLLCLVVFIVGVLEIEIFDWL